MPRERLKDRLEDPHESFFDTFVKAVVVLVSVGAVYWAFSGRGQPAAPAGATNEVAAASDLVLTATKDHFFYWNKEGPLPAEQLPPRLAAWLRTERAPRVLIAADETARLGDAMDLLNEARRQGVTHVSLETRTRPTP